MLGRAAAIKQTGVNLVVLRALSDSGHPAYEAKHAEAFASFGCSVFARTPDQFPSMMACALTGKGLYRNAGSLCWSALRRSLNCSTFSLSKTAACVSTNGASKL